MLFRRRHLRLLAALPGLLSASSHKMGRVPVLRSRNRDDEAFGRRNEEQGGTLAMFDLTFLGTSASVPSADRNHPGLLVEAGGHRIMVDCGEGTQRQLLRSVPIGWG